MLVTYHQKILDEDDEVNKEPTQNSATANAEHSPRADRIPSPNSSEDNQPTTSIMNELAVVLLPIAAIGYSMLYLLFGGGFGGAVVIFIIAKFLGK